MKMSLPELSQLINVSTVIICHQRRFLNPEAPVVPPLRELRAMLASTCTIVQTIAAMDEGIVDKFSAKELTQFVETAFRVNIRDDLAKDRAEQSLDAEPNDRAITSANDIIKGLGL